MSDNADFEMMMAALAGDYLDETTHKLDDIQESLDDIDRQIGIREENLLIIKRDIHSIKGGGIPFGFPTISKVCHGLEDYLETTSDDDNINVSDVQIFIDGIRSVISDRAEPEELDQEMLLKSLPSGRKQSGKMAITQGVGLLVMPKGLQRKIISQELAQFGYKVTLEESPIMAIDMALVLKPDFVIVSMVNERLSGIEIVNMFHSAHALRHIPFAIFTANEMLDMSDCPETTTIIQKGPTFTQGLLKFVKVT